MNFVLEQLQGIRKLLDRVPTQPGVPSSTFVGIRAKKQSVLFSLSSTVSVESKVQGDLADGYWAVDRRVLFPFLDSLNDNLDLTISDSTLALKSGKRKASLRVVEPNWSYGALSTAKPERYPLSEEFRLMLSQVRLCASDDPILPEVNCVYVEFGKREYLFSTNDIVLCMAVGDSQFESANPAWAVPIPLIDAMSQMNAEEMFVDQRVFGVTTEYGSLWANAPEKAWEGFPKNRIKNLIVQVRKAPPLLVVDAQVLSDICQRFVKYLAYVPRAEWSMQITTASKTKAVATSQTMYANFTEEFPIEATAEGKVDINLALIAPVLQTFKESIPVKISQVQDSIARVQIHRYEFLISQRV